MSAQSVLLSACCLVVLAAASAHAYSDPAQYAVPTLEAGGGGRFYTGSAADGFACDSCHTGGRAPTLRISGLPAQYEPGKTYELRVAWPLSVKHGAVSFELTDEHGRGAGELALPAPGTYFTEEECEPAEFGVLAAQLYAADTARTIVAAPDCGATAVHVQWTAPGKVVGSVWLAGAVLAADHDGSFDGDGVTRFLVSTTVKGQPLASRAVMLEGGCSVGANAFAKRVAVFPRCVALLLSVASLLLVRRRLRRVVSGPATTGLACALWLAGCEVDEASLPIELVNVRTGHAVTPWTGAQRLGASAMDAGEGMRDAAGRLDASEQPVDASEFMDDAGLDSGLLPDGAARVLDASLPGEPTHVSFTVTTLPQGGRYSPRNAGAIWVEDGSGAYVRTLALWASIRVRYLAEYAASNPTHNKVDAITSASLRAHQTHTVDWDLTDLDGEVVQDGTYNFVIEVTEKDAPGHFARFEFTKGSLPVVVTPKDGDYFVDVAIRFW